MISKFILKTFGWKEIGAFPDLKKCVVIIAPHTSLMDFVIGKLYYSSIRKKPKFIIKKEFFVFPFGYILKAIGGIAVDRKKGVSIIEQIVEKFKKSENLIVNITPEGTRKKVKRWKKGFYQIAEKANISIAVSCIDYKKKQMGVIAVFHTTGDYNKDIKEIRNYYKGISGKYPEKFYIEDE